jgi:thioredoxin reductase
MHFDVVIIGGSFAGLSAALYLARARRSVCVIDSGQPRNRFADQSHGFLTQDGSDPRAMLATARAQVGAYETVRFIQGTAIDACKHGSYVSVELDSSDVITCSRLLLAFGISDTLPDIRGLAERWGKSVIHCPYCHGYEFSGRSLGVLNVSPMSSHQALLISEWGPTTFYLNGGDEPDAATADHLGRRNIRIERVTVDELVGSGPQLSQVLLADGRAHDVDAVFIAPRNELNSSIASQLGCQIDAAPLGSMVRVDEMKMTTINGVYAAGDIARGGHSIAFACADGVMVAIAMHRSLVFDAPAAEARA